MKAVTDESNITMEIEVLKVAAKSTSLHLCHLEDFGEDNQMYFIVINLVRKFKLAFEKNQNLKF